MRRLSIALVVAASTIAFSQAGSAAPPAPAPMYNWTGCYIGGNAGYAWDHAHPSSDYTSTVGINVPFVTEILYGQSQSLNRAGFTGGVDLGCNWQALSNLVLGIETDFSSLGITRDIHYVSPIFPTLHTSTTLSTKWLYTARGRVGYAWNDWLFYGTGGVAIARTELDETYEDIFPGFGTFEASDGRTKKDLTGWTAGGGIEHLMGPFTVRVEYLYIDLGGISTSAPIITLGVPNGIILNNSARVLVQVARVGFTYRFIGAQ
jgi:outer membrane immunogenic protein